MFLSLTQECEAFRTVTEQTGYVTATVNGGSGREILDTDYRNSLRCISMLVFVDLGLFLD